ncbi:MAG: adenylate kinase [Oscillospiraceae bacterium]|nr:adenylate kinase [Oscillospiraceae bacterium]MBQ2231563.1 adenylate kinase [Oscillospiraceae bacterium]MBQ2329391.1 adenylate kinase [Oscillospiraceae bacterium]MBQ3952281.1 adenylate kinase [Oscillospiraceae bacterium]MBQ5514275.1 adenylate kinase [Oscillospiraceae bacterium]
MKLIIMGAPGAGKGTQAEILSEKLGIPTISTGNILRAAVRDGTPVGRKAKALIEAGSLVSDDVIIGILNERLGHEDCANGYILDGVPRTLAQADMLHAEGVEVDAVIDIDVSDGAIEKRMTGRRTCSGCSATYHVAFNPPATEGVCDHCGGRLTIRKDDLPETVRHRLEVYHAETEPLLDYYEREGKLLRVNGEQSLEATTASILAALEELEI